MYLGIFIFRLIGANAQAIKKRIGRPPTIIKEVKNMITNIRNSNAADVNDYVADILKDTTDTHLTNYLIEL